MYVRTGFWQEGTKSEMRIKAHRLKAVPAAARDTLAAAATVAEGGKLLGC